MAGAGEDRLVDYQPVGPGGVGYLSRERRELRAHGSAGEQEGPHP